MHGTWGSAPALECLLEDTTGEVWVVLLGRREHPGLAEGAEIDAMGTPGLARGRIAILNPLVELLPRDGAPHGGETDGGEQVTGQPERSKTEGREL